jgi:hypothetical protein
MGPLRNIKSFTVLRINDVGSVTGREGKIHVGALRCLIIWHPLKPIFYKSHVCIFKFSHIQHEFYVYFTGS